MPPRRILILGSTGQLGGALLDAAAGDARWEVRGLSHADLELRDAAAVRAALAGWKPLAVVNATAYNAVEAAETSPGDAFAVNAGAVANLAVACREHGAALVHVSTDYVFDGNLRRPYTEADAPAPLNLYGLSKLAGEEAIRRACPRHCILRTCGLYGRHRSPRGKRNFVDTILDRARRGEPLRVRDDLTCTPTSAAELAATVWKALEAGAEGTFHATNRGHCSWHGFAVEILRRKGIGAEVRPAEGAPPPGGAPRPAWSVLDGSALAVAGVPAMSPWQEALAAYLDASP